MISVTSDTERRGVIDFTDVKRSVDSLIIHCSDSNFGDRAEIDMWHTERGFDEIGYHFVILNPYQSADNARERTPSFRNDGVLEIGRDIERIGAHCLGWNQGSIGVCLIGRDVFTSMQIATLKSLVISARDKWAGIQIYGHYERIADGQPTKTCPNIDMEILRQILNS